MRVFEYPNPVLKQSADPVDAETDSDLRSLAEHMVRLMRDAPGVGLAATQLGVQKRLIVFQIEEEGDAQALANPVITECSETTSLEEEGCLSFPGISIPIERPSEVVCEGVSLDGQSVRIEATELLARVLQHEIDHLDGVLIIDRAALEERKAALRRYRELKE